jgi:hypothetical protein
LDRAIPALRRAVSLSLLIIGRTGGAGFLVLFATPVDIGFSIDHVEWSIQHTVGATMRNYLILVDSVTPTQKGYISPEKP